MIDTSLIGGQPVSTLVQLRRYLFVEPVEGGPDRIRLDEEIPPHIALAVVKTLRVIKVEIALSGRAEFPGQLDFETFYTMTRRLAEATGHPWGDPG
jgi:hypothetical protein